MLPEKIHELESLIIKNLTLGSNVDVLNINVEKVNGKTAENNLSIDYLSLNCKKDQKDFTTALLDLCLNHKSNFSSSKLIVDGNDVNNLKVKIENSKLNFEAKLSGVAAKGRGQVNYLQSEKKIIIRVDKVKAGLFSVTGKFFKEIKAKESERLIVNKPYIEILLD